MNDAGALCRQPAVGEVTIFGLLFLVCVFVAFFLIVPSETM